MSSASLIQPINDFGLLIFGMKRASHTHSDICDGLYILCYNWVVLRIRNLIGLRINLMENTRLYSKILATLYLLICVTRPWFPWSINGVIMFLVFFILFLTTGDTGLRNIEIDFSIVACNRESLSFMMQRLISEEFGGSPEFHKMFPSSFLIGVLWRCHAYLIPACLINTNTLWLKTLEHFLTTSFAHYTALIISASHLVPVEVRSISI